MTSRRHFHRGAPPVFTCAVCNRRTRHVESTDSQLCPHCWELAGWDNHHNDNGTPPTGDELQAYERIVSSAARKGGDPDAIRSAFPYIWRTGR